MRKIHTGIYGILPPLFPNFLFGNWVLVSWFWRNVERNTFSLWGIKNLPAMQETLVQSLGWEVSLEKETATHSSILAWRMPWTEEIGSLQSIGLQRLRQEWAIFNFTFMSCEEKHMSFERLRGTANIRTTGRTFTNQLSFEKTQPYSCIYKAEHLYILRRVYSGSLSINQINYFLATELFEFLTYFRYVDKGLYSQSYGFPSSHVQMWEMGHKEGWALKNWFFWTVVLEKTLERPLDSKEIKQVNPKGNQPWIFTGRTATKAEALILWPPDMKSQLIGKDPDAGKDWRQEETVAIEDEVVKSHHQLNGHEFEQTPGHSEGQEAWCAAVHGIAKSQTRLSK